MGARATRNPLRSCAEGLRFKQISNEAGDGQRRPLRTGMGLRPSLVTSEDSVTARGEHPRSSDVRQGTPPLAGDRHGCGTGGRGLQLQPRDHVASATSSVGPPPPSASLPDLPSAENADVFSLVAATSAAKGHASSRSRRCPHRRRPASARTSASATGG